MSHIFLSHASADNSSAIALRDWLARNGWKDEIFLDLDAQRGIVAGARWERALHQAASRCEAVLFLVSKAWLASVWCRKELNLAHSLNKRLFGILIEDLQVGELPEDLTGTWQIVRLATGQDHVVLRAVLPITHEEAHVHFSAEGLQRLKHGLEEAGLEPKYFAWPPQNDLNRPPYRGLRPLEAEDAGIFFGREAPIIEAIDQLRGLREVAPPRLMAILGASGAGKSSFLRAGLLPRLARDDRTFLPLPIVRPERAPISGETGFIRALEGALAVAEMPMPRADIREVLKAGAERLRPLLERLVAKATPRIEGEPDPKPPTLVISIDQAEELFLVEGQEESQHFLALLRDLICGPGPASITLFTIRSDNYERLQQAEQLEGVRKVPFDLGPMPRGAYVEVIRGPTQRSRGTPRELSIDDNLIEALLADMDAGGARDALPLLAFTLERLYDEFHAGGQLTLAHYDRIGRVKGSIEAAVERALAAADTDHDIPRDRAARLSLLRKGLIPWLAGIDPDTGAPRRRLASLAEIPSESRPLIQHLVEQRLLATDVAKETGKSTIEPAHEALLRQWSLLQGWLTEDAGLLSVLDGVKRAARDWDKRARNAAWLTHTTGRLEAAERLRGRPDLSALLEPTDRDYLSACSNAEHLARQKERTAARNRQRLQAAIALLLVGIIAGLVGWINQSYLTEQITWFRVMRPYMLANVRPYVLSEERERALKANDSFRECARDCPEMIVVPPGSLMMGSPATEAGRFNQEGPQQHVTIARPFAVSKYLVTFDDWEACVAAGGCPEVSDSGFGRGTRPVVNVTWGEAQRYVAWLSRMTERRYRLLSEAEWEYVARAGTTTAYWWGEDVGRGNANCNGCGSSWDGVKTSPVGSFRVNPFGLYDAHGNIVQWVADCYHDNLEGTSPDGAPRTTGDCRRRTIRGGSWYMDTRTVRAAYRSGGEEGNRLGDRGFRVARTLSASASGD
jgi:formylglycine-generating enzyme required for sulfatase activity